MNIYVLECENNKYYIGKTNNIDSRLKLHNSGMGSEWTKKYKPLNINKQYDGTKHSEDEITQKYMEIYGVENVRGGAFCKIELPDYQLKTLNDIFNSKNDTCYNCGLKGHFISDCPKKSCGRCGRNSHNITNCFAKTHLNGYSLITQNSDNKLNYKESYSYASRTCFRCGRDSHLIYDCFATTHLDGYYLSDIEDDSEYYDSEDYDSDYSY